MMTQRDNIIKAIEYLEKAVDIFPDKDEEIYSYNEIVCGIIATLKRFCK